MSNPAALLHTQLKYWRVEKGEVVRDARLSSAESDEEVMIETQRAMLHIQNLEEILTSMEAANRRTGPYRQALPRWRKWIMCYPSSWYHPQADGRFASERDLDILENLADALDQTLPVFAENDRVGMRETLEDIRAAIANDASLPEPLRRHLHGLLAHTSMCLEEYDAFGDFELQRR